MTLQPDGKPKFKNPVSTSGCRVGVDRTLVFYILGEYTNHWAEDYIRCTAASSPALFCVSLGMF